MINRKKMAAMVMSLFFIGATTTVFAQVPQQPQPTPQQQPQQMPRQQPQQMPQQQQPTDLQKQQLPQQQQPTDLQKQQPEQQLQHLNQDQGNQEVSDKELKEFASVYPKVQKESQKAQQTMASVIEKDGMKLERFNELQTAQMQNKDLNADKQEMKTFNKIKKELDKIQPEIQKEIQSLVKSSGLSVERFQAIASAIQNNPDLQNRFQKILAENGGKA